jgi:hypothetical protein
MLGHEHDLAYGSEDTVDAGAEGEAQGAQTVLGTTPPLGLELLCICISYKGGTDVGVGQAPGEASAP